MDWSNEAVMDFLGYYEEEPVLWKTTLGSHKNRIATYDAWKRIQNKLGGTYSVDDLKKKKESLMSSFRFYKRKVKESMKNANEKDEIYQPNWFAYQKMLSFSTKKELSNDPITSEVILPQKEFENVAIKKEVDIGPSTKSEPTEIKIFNKDLLLSSTSSTSIKTILPKKRSNNKEVNFTSKIYDAYEILQNSIKRIKKEKDIYDLYGELIAAKLRSMDEQCKEIAMHEIGNIFFQTKMNCNTKSNNHQQHNNKYDINNTKEKQFLQQLSKLKKLKDINYSKIDLTQTPIILPSNPCKNSINSIQSPSINQSEKNVSIKESSS